MKIDDSLPEFWRRTHISQVAQVIMGQSPPGNSYNNNKIGLPLVVGASDLGIEFPNPQKWTTNPTRTCAKGDLIYCVRATVGDMNWADREYSLGRGVSALRSNEDLIDRFYLYYWLLANRGNFMDLGVGSTFTQIRRSHLENAQITVPPLPEQRRIVEILRQADELRRMREEAVNMVWQLLLAIFYDMFGNPFAQNALWEKKTIREIGTVATGNTPPRNNPVNYGGFIDWVKTDELNSTLGYVLPSKERLSTEGAKKGKIASKGSTLVACIAGSINSIGRTALTQKNVAFNQQINAITPFKDVNPYYVYAVLTLSKHMIQNRARRALQFIINKTELEDLKIICPPKRLQDRFGERLHELFQLRSEFASSANYFDELSETLLTQAFTGKLTATWREKHRSELEKAAALRDVLLGQTESTESFDLNAEGEREVFTHLVNRELPKMVGSLIDGKNVRAGAFEAFFKGHIKPHIESYPSLISAKLFGGLENLDAEKRKTLSARMKRTPETTSDFETAEMGGWVKHLAYLAALLPDAPDPSHPRYGILSQLSAVQYQIYRATQATESYFIAEHLDHLNLPKAKIRETLKLLVAVGLILEVTLLVQSGSATTAYRSLRPADDVKDEPLVQVEQESV